MKSRQRDELNLKDDRTYKKQRVSAQAESKEHEESTSHSSDEV